jgi:exonuclease V
MCYKYMWDNLVADHFSSKQFFDFFTLNPHSVLSEEIRERTADSGFPAKVSTLFLS